MIATPEKLKKVISKNGGNLSKAAKEIGMTPAGVSKRLTANPELKKSIQDQCRKNLARAGASVSKIFKRTAEGLDATKSIPGMKIKLGDGEDAGISAHLSTEPDYKERREAAKLCHQLIGNLIDPKDGESTGPQFVVNMPIVVIDGKPLGFKVGNNVL